MNFIKLFNRLSCVMQWSIGFSKGNIEQIIRERKCSLSFKWIPLIDNITSIADPFIFNGKDGKLNMLYEDFSVLNTENYGTIKLAQLDDEFNVTSTKEILDAKSHSSYPLVFIENNITYIIPETSQQKKVSIFEYDDTNNRLFNERVLINDSPLLDSTIFTHNNKYWLFATENVNEYDYCSLNIFYAESLLGPYLPHANNPVKNIPDGSRPAGNVIKVDGELYRPAQNCSLHYGESIAINKIIKLSETEFSEEFHFRIAPDKSSQFKSGVHTINILNDIIVIDGIKLCFNPLLKWGLFFRKKFKK